MHLPPVLCVALNLCIYILDFVFVFSFVFPLLYLYTLGIAMGLFLPMRINRINRLLHTESAQQQDEEGHLGGVVCKKLLISI